MHSPMDISRDSLAFRPNRSRDFGIGRPRELPRYWRKVKATLGIVCGSAVLGMVALAQAQTAPAPGQPAPATLSIDQAVDEALRNNLDLLAEKQNVPVAKAREITAALRPNPTVMLTWDYLDWLRRGLSAANSAGPSEFTPQFNYTWERGGKRDRRMELAAAVTSIAELRLLDSMRQLGLAVRLACVDFLLARENVVLAEQNLSVFKDIVQVNEAKVHAGDLAGVELIRTRVAQQQLQNDVAQAQLKLQTARNNIQQLLGRNTLLPEFEITGSLRNDGAVLMLDEIRRQALADRPDLQALRKDIVRAQADERLQQANAKQDITTGLVYHHQYGYSTGRTFGVMATIPLPVYDHNQGEIARAQRETTQSQYRVKAMETSITTEVQNAWQQYTTAKALLDRIRGDLLTQAQQVRDITEFSYRRGEASLLEFLDAQRTYNDTMQSYNDARADYTRSLFLIDAVTAKSVTP